MQEMKRRSMLLLSLLLAATMAFSLSAVMPSSADAAAGEATPMIAAGHNHSMALKSDGTVWAWGSNSNGQLGNNSTTDSNIPVQVSGLTGATAIAAGYDYSMALKSDGTVWAWGWNGYGQLGNGTTAESNTPVQVLNLTGATAIAACYDHSMALKSDGTVWAWGWNGYGQLGNNSTTNSKTPVQVSGLTGTVTAIAAGYSHSMALKSDGTVWAWGSNGSGQLGNGGTTNSYIPVQVSGLTGATAISAGGYHSLALKSDGTVWAWGYNYYGQLGNNSTTNSKTPVQVSGLIGVTAISAGYYHSMALKSNGTVWAWGSNSSGQLGNNGTADSSTPVQVNRLLLYLTLSAGSVDRTSDTAATISFTTSYEGTAYYAVLESGSGKPSKETVRSGGTSLGVVTAGTVTGLPVALTAGAKDIYVVLENTTMNQISEPLKIEAAAWESQEKGSSDNSMMIIAAAVLALAVVGFLVYWFVIRKRTP